MQKTQLIKALSALSVALFVGGTVTTVDASAKAVKTKGFRVTKITKNTHYAKTPYTKKSPKKGVTLYSSRYLTKHTTSKKTKTFYSTQSIRVVKSTGKTATYRYVKNAKGSVKGWIWTGNLEGKQGKTKSVSNKTVIAPTTNVKIAKKTTVTPVKNTSSDSSNSFDPSDSFDPSVDSDSENLRTQTVAEARAELQQAVNLAKPILDQHPDDPMLSDAYKEAKSTLEDSKATVDDLEDSSIALNQFVMANSSSDLEDSDLEAGDNHGGDGIDYE